MRIDELLSSIPDVLCRLGCPQYVAMECTWINLRLKVDGWWGKTALKITKNYIAGYCKQVASIGHSFHTSWTIEQSISSVPNWGMWQRHYPVKQDATQSRFTFLRISVHGQQSWWLPSNMLADIVGQSRRSLRASAWSFVWLEAIIAMPCIDAHKKRINMDQHGLSWRETMWPCHWWNAMMSILEQSWKIHKHPMNGCWRRYWGAWLFEQLFERSKLFNRWWVWFLWVQCKHKLNNYKNQEGEHRRTRR